MYNRITYLAEVWKWTSLYRVA